MSGPARGRRRRATLLRALLPCLALIAFDERLRRRPRPSPRTCSAPRATASSRRRICRCARPRSASSTALDDARRSRRDELRDKDEPAPSRIGQIPTYGLPAASGASDSGFDSLNRTRKKPKFYPGQAKPKPPPGPGSRRRRRRRRLDADGRCGCRSRRRRPPTRRRCRRRWPAPCRASRRASG